jgi:hypothetical protein
MNILDAYIKTTPNDQNILDLFDNEWSLIATGGGRFSRLCPGN